MSIGENEMQGDEKNEGDYIITGRDTRAEQNFVECKAHLERRQGMRLVP
jgi:hypothetical protein